jgi:hypothetical protein
MSKRNELLLERSKWTVTDVADQFEEAVSTLRRLPRIKVQGHFNAWPTVVHSTVELMQAEKKPLRLGPPSSSAISRMEECFEWVFWLDDETERKLVWLRAKKVYWKQICWQVGFSRTKAWQLYTIALLKIVTRLNARQMRQLHVHTKKG